MYYNNISSEDRRTLLQPREPAAAIPRSVAENQTKADAGEIFKRRLRRDDTRETPSEKKNRFRPPSTRHVSNRDGPAPKAICDLNDFSRETIFGGAAVPIRVPESTVLAIDFPPNSGYFAFEAAKTVRRKTRDHFTDILRFRQNRSSKSLPVLRHSVWASSVIIPKKEKEKSRSVWARCS